MRPAFHFKQFAVTQDRAAMKVGTDSVLLGCMAEPGNAKRILDIGTGTGLLALMMAQRTNAEIDAVELDEDAFREARENFAYSPWNERLKAFLTPIQQFDPASRYDLIISNPPYFRSGTVLKSVDPARSLARQNEALPFDLLCKKAKELLDDRGSFWLVLPVAELTHFQTAAEMAELHLSSLTKIRYRPESEDQRAVMCWKKKAGPVSEKQFILHNGDDSPSAEYISLTWDFLLWKNRDSPEPGTVL